MKSHGNQARALVDQLIERMLAVGARLAPVDRAGLDSPRGRRRASRACRCSPSSTAGDRRESVSGTVRTAGRRRSWRRRNRCTRRSSNPSSTGRLRSNGAVRKCSSIWWKPSSMLTETLRTDGEHRREADRRVHRIAAADPVPEAEHVRGVDAELRDLCRVRRDGDEVPGDRLDVTAEAREQPVRGRSRRWSSSRAS